MYTVWLIHWNEREASERAARLQSSGYDVDHSPFSPATFKSLQQRPPGAVVIDLSRIPSQGRDVAMAVRSYKSTRNIPIVFVGGEPEKVSKIRAQLPDADYTHWDRIQETLEKAIKHPSNTPFTPRSRLEGYSGVPLAKKLGVKTDTTIALLNASRGFDKKLGKLPRGVVVRRDIKDSANVTVWFTKTREELEGRILKMAHLAHNGGLWIAWPKKSSGEESDLSEIVVRKGGLAAGLVDYKICSIDATWSGLRFTKRRTPSGGSRSKS